LAMSTLLNTGRGSLAGGRAQAAPVSAASHAALRQAAGATIIPAPTVPLLASSIRMKLPVRRFAA
jgi:hypothetical protein